MLQNTGKHFEKTGDSDLRLERGNPSGAAQHAHTGVRKRLEDHGRRLLEGSNFLPVLQFSDHPLKDYTKR